MKTYTITRTGDRPLKFNGEVLAESSSKKPDGPCSSRYWDLALWRTDSGKFVLSAGYFTQWQGESRREDVFVEATAEAAAEQLQKHDYLAPVVGFPPGHEDRQHRLEQQLTLCWEAAVTEILSALPAEEI